MTKQEKINQEVADAIKDFLIENDLSADTRIYFNNKAYHFDSFGKLEKTLTDIKASEYFEFANDKTVSVSFEGPFYRVMNLSFESKHYRDLEAKFLKLVEKFGYYYEMGHAWNLTLYEN